MLKITLFSLASGRHRECLCFMLIPSLCMSWWLTAFQTYMWKHLSYTVCRPEDDIRHWSKFPSFTPLLVIGYLTWYCSSSWIFWWFVFMPFLQSQIETDGGKSLDFSNYPYIFMVWDYLTCSFVYGYAFYLPFLWCYMQRWKEQYFVNVGADCGLTIAGFYYVCFSCSDGSISGFYYDPNSR
jgi:hypothetical protein